jgi:hypothetical protein
MANNLGAGQGFSPELWSARVQILRKNNLVAGAICNTEERSTLTYGTRVHRPIPSQVFADTYTKGTAAVTQDISSSDQYLDVDQAKIIPIYLDDIDRIQNKYKTLDIFSERAAYELKNQIDFSVLSEGCSNAALGNTTAATFSPSNVSSYFSQAKADLFNNGVEETKPWYAVVDGDTVSTLEQFQMFNGFKNADDVIVNGYGISAYLGEYAGLQFFKSQNLPTSAVLTSSSTPSDGQTVTINGITFTAKTALTPLAGEFLIGGSADAARANLTALINDPLNRAVSTNYVALTNTALHPDAINVLKRNLVATNNNSADTLTLTAAGKMVLGTPTWTGATWGTQTMKMLVGQMGAIDLVMQEDVTAEFARMATNNLVGTKILTWDLYGKKMFDEGAQRSYALTVTK